MEYVKTEIETNDELLNERNFRKKTIISRYQQIQL